MACLICESWRLSDWGNWKLIVLHRWRWSPITIGAFKKKMQGGHWGLQYSTIFLWYFSNFNLEMQYCSIVRTCWIRFLSILESIRNYSTSSPTFLSFFQFLFECSQWNWTLMGMENCNSSCCKQKKETEVIFCLLLANMPMDVIYLIVLSKSQITNLSTFINKPLIFIATFYSNLNIQSSSFGMTLSFVSVLKYCRISWNFCDMVVFRISNVPLLSLRAVPNPS